MTNAIRVGCSGWQYRHWKGRFYPTSLPVSQWLTYYMTQFDTVELNNTFYRLPQRSVFANWRKRTRRGFRYSLKASRYLTHMRKLIAPEQPLELFFARARELRSSLGPVLYQLPPRFDVNLQRLQVFLQALPRRHRHVIEMRDERWYRQDVFDLLTEHGVALCLHDMVGSVTPRRQIGPFIYLRLHGPRRYQGSYSDDQLAEWAEWLASVAAVGTEVYVYFNNDIDAAAPHDARRLRQLLEGMR
jgi:uncharacterized protein YecE (DUF72 family)